MNTYLLATELVTMVRNSMQDSVINQVAVAERMILNALGEGAQFDTKAIDWLEQEIGLSIRNFDPPWQLQTGVFRLGWNGENMPRPPLRMELEYAMRHKRTIDDQQHRC